MIENFIYRCISTFFYLFNKVFFFLLLLLLLLFSFSSYVSGTPPALSLLYLSLYQMLVPFWAAAPIGDKVL